MDQVSSGCRGCGAPLPPQKAPGRQRVWCSDRCRKQTLYSQPCVDCGTPTNGSDGLRDEPRCVPCANAVNAAARRVWTPERIIERIREWAAEYGEPPALPDWSPRRARDLNDEARARRFEEAGGYWPWFTGVVRVFGSWNAAIAAAGFEPRPQFGGGENVARRRSVRAKAVA